MQVTVLALAFIGVSATSALAQRADDCRHEAQRGATVDANGARRLLLDAGAGSLKVEGKPGLTRVAVRGRACASSANLLQEIDLVGRRNGGDVVVVANVHRASRRNWMDNEYARLDIVLEVPARLDTEIEDGSGSIELSNLGAVRIEDGSGDIVADNLHGDVDIDDGSGEIRLVDVAGAVKIKDGSGTIELRNIGGLIEIDDSSGEIRIRGTRNSVRLSDGSGNIDVRDVAGDLIVEDDGSGGIDYDNIKGRVEIPRNKRR